MNWKHIALTVRKDIRAQKFHLILWVCLLAIYVALAGLWGGDRPAGASFTTLMVHLLPGVVMVYGLAIAVILIHEDPVAGTTAFWLTRPVRGPSLLVAKAIEIVAMLVIWFLGDLLVLVTRGAPGHAGYLGFSFASGLLPAILVVLAIAALAPNTPRFLLAIALLSIGSVVVAMLVNLVGGWFQDPGQLKGPRRSPGESLSAELVGAGIASLGALAILIWQFATRRTGVSITAAMVLGAGTVLAVTGWSHDFISPPTVQSDLSKQYEGVGVEIDWSELRSGVAYELDGDSDPIGYRTVSALASVRGLPNGVFAWWKSARSRVITPDGREFVQQPERAYEHSPSAGISAALGGARVSGGDGGGWWRALVRTGEETFEQFAGQPCSLVSEVELELSRYELVGELALEAGAELEYDGLRVRVTGIVPIAASPSGPASPAPRPAAGLFQECEVHFTEQYPISKLRAVREGRDGHSPYSDLIYVLVNRERNEAMRSNGGGSSSFTGIRTMFRNNERHLDFEPAYTGVADRKAPELDRAWLAGATLAVLKRSSLGELTCTASIDEIVFEK